MSILQNLKLSASARKKAVLLPDHAFFLRLVPSRPEPAGRGSRTGGAGARRIVAVLRGPALLRLLLPAGASRVLVFAAYRRRFTVEDAEAWAAADVVLPAFAACLGLAPTGRLR